MDIKELISRLREWKTSFSVDASDLRVFAEAADALESQASRLAVLEQAVAPPVSAAPECGARDPFRPAVCMKPLGHEGEHEDARQDYLDRLLAAIGDAEASSRQWAMAPSYPATPAAIRAVVAELATCRRAKARVKELEAQLEAERFEVQRLSQRVSDEEAHSATMRDLVTDLKNKVVELQEPAPTPQELHVMRNRVVHHFPRTGQSNPMHFCLVAGLNPEPERLVVVRATFKELVKEGLLEKLMDGEEYAWCEPVEEAAAGAAPPPRPAATPPDEAAAQLTNEAAKLQKKWDAWAGAHPVAGTDEWYLVRATSEALCRELVWRLATKRLPDECRDAVSQAFANEAFPRVMAGDRTKEP